MTLAVDDLAATLENPAIRAAMAFWSVADEDRDNAMCADGGVLTADKAWSRRGRRGRRGRNTGDIRSRRLRGRRDEGGNRGALHA